MPIQLHDGYPGQPYHPAHASEMAPSGHHWGRRATAVGFAALALVGVTRGPDIFAAANNAAYGPPIERCLDEPLTADTVPTYPTRPAATTVKLPEMPNEADYPTTKAYAKAIDRYFKDWDAASTYVSPEQKAYEKEVAAIDSLFSPADIKLKLGPDGVEGEPRWLYDIAPKVEAATVIVETSNGHGTGFAVTDEQSGDVYIVTAAHVVGTDGMKQLHIKKPNGAEAAVTDGCVIYDDADVRNARFGELGKDSTVEADVAVLRLADTNGLEPLAMRTNSPKRGEWVGLLNFQGPFPTIGSPSSYNGLVVRSWPTEKSYDIVTGFGLMKGSYDTIMSGASGGPVVDKNGSIVGMSYTALRAEYYDGADSLKDFGVAISEKDADKLLLNNGGVMKTSVIREAMSALAAKK